MRNKITQNLTKMVKKSIEGNNEIFNDFYNKLKELYQKKDDNLNDFKREYTTIKEVIIEIYKKIKDNYKKILDPIDRGGSGIIIHVTHKILDQDRVIKIPRPKDDPSIFNFFENEIFILKNIYHENIIHILDSGSVKIKNFNKYPYMILQFIRDPNPLDKYLKNEYIDKNKPFKEVIKVVADKLFSVAKAILYLHEHPKIIPDPRVLDVIYGILHFDIKPDNILVDKEENVYLIDFGISKEKSNDEKKVEMTFSPAFAHPNFISHLARNTSFNRAITKPVFSPKDDFKFFYDIYNFGRTILNLLYIINKKFPSLTSYSYNFIYLHLMACRMLDGKNNQRIYSTDSEFLKEDWRELKADEYKMIKYKHFKDIVKDLESLLISEGLFKYIPEINNYYPKRIHLGEEGSAPFSERIKKIIEHPLFTRLKRIKQLPFMNTIYPSANHSRFEHSLGVLNNCINYIQSLYNDNYNPLFKQLCTENNLKALLLASLLHDLGHFPLAHYIEEVFPEIKHERFTIEYLENDTIINSDGFTLKQLIENDWDIDISDIKLIIDLPKNNEDLVLYMLHSILDGPVDVDKLDWLRRDSYKCYLKYGEIIDYERLIRNLTIVIYEKERKYQFALGIYEKGQIAAESLAFARYCLYQALYFHHTARAVRVMLRETLLATPQKTFTQITIDSRKIKSELNFPYILIEFLKTKPICNRDDILDLIFNNSQDYGRELIKMIKSRNYYKRILTIHYEEKAVEKTLYQKLSESFSDLVNLSIFQDKFQNKVVEAILSIQLRGVSDTFYSKEIHEEIKKEELKSKKIIIIDIPRPILGIESTLRLAPEPKRLWNNYSELYSIGETQSKIYDQIYSNLMNYTAKIRIYCHPSYSKTIVSILGPEKLKKILENLLS